MKVSKTLTSLVAATSLIGAIGIAYAQTGGSGGTTLTPQQAQMGGTDGTPANNSNMNNAQAMPGQAAPMANPAAPGSNQTMGAQTNLPPQADRN